MIETADANAKEDWWRLQNLHASMQRMWPNELDTREGRHCMSKVVEWMAEIEEMTGGKWPERKKTVKQVQKKWAVVRNTKSEESHKRRDGEDQKALEAREKWKREKEDEEGRNEMKKGKQRQE